MKPLLLLLFLCPQDSDVERLVEALSADSIEAREDAMEALARLSPDRLPALERHLAGAPAELRSRLEIAAGRILGSTLGPRALRMEWRPVAPPEVLEAWKQAGADPAKPPAGCQVRRNRRFKGDPDVDPEWILLEAPVASNEDVVQAEVVADPGMPDRPGVAFKLAGKAARRLDEAAAKLSARKPKGRLAIVLEGEILMLPAVQTPKLGASGQIAGLADREAAERCAKWLQGAWFEVRLLAEGGKDPGTAEKILRDELELKAEDLERQADGSVRLGTARKLPDAALYRAWSALRAAGFTLKAAK